VTPETDGRGTATRLARLVREVEPDRQALDRLHAELQAYAPRLRSDPADRPLQALVAIDLHDYYTAAETLFERVARLLDGDVPGGDRWHRDLLQQMATDLLPVRGALLRGEDLPWLEDLLKFRHFLRHAYAVTLGAAPLLARADDVQRRHPHLVAAVDALMAHVAATRARLG